jgi:hypothetical protein
MEMPTTLAMNKLQYQQAQAQLAQYPRYAQTLQNINAYVNGGDPTQPAAMPAGAQPQSTAAPQSQTTQSPTGPVTTTALPSNDQAVAVPSGQQPAQSAAGGLLGSLLHGSVGMVNAASPAGGLLAGAQAAQPTSGCSPRRVCRRRVRPAPSNRCSNHNCPGGTL